MKEKYYGIKDCGNLTFTNAEGKEIKLDTANRVDIWNTKYVDLIAIRYQITDDEKEDFLRNFKCGEIRINFEKRLAEDGSKVKDEVVFKNMSFEKREFWLDYTCFTEYILVFVGGESYFGNISSDTVSEFLDVIRKRENERETYRKIESLNERISGIGVALRDIVGLLTPKTITIGNKDEPTDSKN